MAKPLSTSLQGWTLRRGDRAEKHFEATEMNGVEEVEDRMSEEAGDEVEGEGELASADWRVRARTQKQTDAKEREEYEATHVQFSDRCTLHDGQRTHPITPSPNKRARGSTDKAHQCDVLLLQ